MPDYKVDADTFLQKVAEEVMKTEDESPLAEPDPNLEMADNGYEFVCLGFLFHLYTFRSGHYVNLPRRYIQLVH